MRQAALFLLLSVVPPAGAQDTVRFATQDGWTIVASYHRPRKGKAVAVMVHGVAAGKGEWGLFAQKLQGQGLGTLALDLRGHGESLGGPAGRRDFTDFDAAGEWPSAQKDVAAAVAFLKKKGLPASRIALAGASIGANLVAREAASSRFAWVLLLSPGMDYRGVALPSGFGKNKVLLAASPPDLYADQTVKSFAARFPVLEAGAGHGVQMFEDAAFLDEVLKWVKTSEGL